MEHGGKGQLYYDNSTLSALNRISIMCRKVSSRMKKLALLEQMEGNVKTPTGSGEPG